MEKDNPGNKKKNKKEESSLIKDLLSKGKKAAALGMAAVLVTCMSSPGCAPRKPKPTTGPDAQMIRAIEDRRDDDQQLASNPSTSSGRAYVGSFIWFHGYGYYENAGRPVMGKNGANWSSPSSTSGGKGYAIIRGGSAA
jgi:hypothetical protein